MAVTIPARALAWPRVRSVTVGISVDLILATSLVGLALAVRWPNLLLSPQFPTFGASVLRALEVANGQALPLSDQAPYIGAIFLYILAAVYKLFGSSLEATMLVALVLGSLTVVPVYLLGRELGGRVAGLVAGGLMVTAGAHVVVSSHVPMSHSVTPLFATTTLWLLARAVKRGEPGSLVLAGLGTGLSLQTHPTVAPLLIGAAGGALLQRSAWLRTRWLYLALGLLLLGYSTMLVFHVQSRLEVVGDIQGKQARYLDDDVDAGEDSDHGVYVNNLDQLGLSLSRLLSGAIEERETREDFLLDPKVLIYPALALVGLALAARQGSPWLVLAVLPAILLPPLFNGKYKPVMDGRYIMPLLPVLFVGIGLGFAAAVRAVEARRAWLLGLPVVLVAAWLTLHPLALLASFYEDSQEDGASNVMYLRTLDQLKAAHAGREPILLDDRLVTVKGIGGGNAGRTFEWLLGVSHLPYQSWQARDGAVALVGHLAVLHRDTADMLSAGLVLTPLDSGRHPGRKGQSYRAYHVSARS